MAKTHSSNSRGTKKRGGSSSVTDIKTRKPAGKMAAKTRDSKWEKLLRTRSPRPVEPTQNPRPARHRKQSPNKRSQLDRLKITDTPLAVAFRNIEPTWRNYIEYVSLAAAEGDDDMKKVLAAYNGLPRREQITIMPEALCDLSGVKASVLVGAVSREYWSHKQAESAITASSRHPKMVEATADFGCTFPQANKDRELFFRVTGAVPDKKGASIVINNNPQTAHISQSPAGANGFRPMDQRIIEMGRLLDPPCDENITSVPMFDENTGDVFDEDSIEED